MLVLSYPLDQIDFRDWARSTLGVDRLEDLHLLPDARPFANYVGRLEHYVGLLRNNFNNVRRPYMRLLDLIKPLFDGVTLRQDPPSFRCHLVGGGTASAFHRDGDAKYNIEPGVINCWVPLTTVGGNNSLFIESEYGSENYQPVSLEPGQALIFDAFHLKHGSISNNTANTRVSFDFRFQPNNVERARALNLYPVEQPVGAPA